MVTSKITSELINKSYIIGQHKSGLDIYLYPMKGFSSSYAIFGTRYGSVDNSYIDENKTVVDLPEGIAHFLEHKLFESEDGDAFERYSKTGAYANAYTSFDRTCYLFSCSNKFYDNLKILLDFVRSPYFTEKTVQKEQGIIGQEIKMYDDLPSWRVMFNMLEGMFYNNPVKIDIAGTTESISKITDKLLYSCYDRFYDLSNMFLVISGDFDCEEVLDFIDKNLKVNDNSVKTKTVFKEEPDTVVKNHVSEQFDVANPMFCIGFKETPGESPISTGHMVAMEILMKMLFGTASELYKELLEENLINESFSMEYFNGRGFALPLLSGESENSARVLELILKKVQKFKSNGLDEKLFEAIRREMYGRGLRQFDAAESVCSMFCDAAVLGYDLFSHFDCIKSIKPEDVMKCLDIFRHENAVLSELVPKRKLGKQ